KRLGFYLGDVVGKGLPAAMYAALAIGTLRGIKKTGEQPTDVLGLLNRRLRMRVPPARYCAVQYGVFDPATRELCYSNAGLPRPLHISDGGCVEIGAGGLPSGLFPDSEYEQYKFTLGPGDAVLFTSDGIIEAQNAKGEDFGLERLMEVSSQPRGQSADILLARVFEAVDRFVAGAPQHDDMAAAVLKLS
ncbi:MAG TPA: PP2C family protein-serine/threonine phosphatase, partial [Anaerolineales bacterium]